MSRRVFIAGHNGMVGSAIVRAIAEQPDTEIITADRTKLDLSNQASVSHFFARHDIDEVYLCAARVGGIHANETYPANFIYDNLILECNVIHQAYLHGVKKLLFLGSSCIYPRMAEQPMREDALLTGPLEPTNEPYAIAKIAGIKLCESYNRQYGVDYRSVMPTNLFGPGDNFHLHNSHVIPALIRRFHEAVISGADSVTNWGSGKARREFLHVEDMARASVFVMNLSKETYQSVTSRRVSHVNVGVGSDCTIEDLVNTIASVTGYGGEIEWDLSKPDGAPRKLMDSSKLRKLGWVPKFDLRTGIEDTYTWYREHVHEARL